MDKATKYTVLFAIILISLSVFYYFVIFLPSQERINAEFQREQYQNQQQVAQREAQERVDSNLSLNMCLNEAQTNRDDSVRYWTEWGDKTCVGNNNSYVNKCLDAVLAEAEKANIRQKEDEDKCIRLYK